MGVKNVTNEPTNQRTNKAFLGVGCEDKYEACEDKYEDVVKYEVCEENMMYVRTNMKHMSTNMRMWTNMRYVRRLQKLHISYPVLISYISRQKFQEYVIPSASITEKNWLTLC